MSKIDHGAVDDAPVWLARWRSGQMSAIEQQRFQHWLNIPGKRAEFDTLHRLYDGMQALAKNPGIEAARVAALQRAAPAKAAFFPRLALVAATVAALICGALVLFAAYNDKRPAAEVFRTASNQRQIVDLQDGSRVVLDAGTQIAVRFSKTGRHVDLEQGRAYFTVAKNTERPFVVHTPAGSVWAVGTAFSVDDRKDQVSVLLSEGKVRVEFTAHTDGRRKKIITMEPGTELSLKPAGWSLQRKSPDQALAWTEGLVVFDNIRLADAVAEFNMHSPRKIELAGTLGDERISGTFRIGMTDEFVRALVAYRLARVAHENGQKVELTAASAK